MADESCETITFYISHNIFNNSFDNYPKRLITIIEDELQKKQEETGLMVTTESNKIRLTPSFHQMTRPLPDFFEASISWLPGYTVTGLNVLVGVQMTPRNGYRNIYKITFNEGDTQYMCPVRKQLIDIPLFILDSETHKQIKYVFWSNSPINFGNKLEQIRNIEKDSWGAYKKENSDIIINAIEQKQDFCEINIGTITIKIQLKNDDLPIGFGYQIINGRKHFIKIIDSTQQEYEEFMQKQETVNKQIIEQSIGDTTTCSICCEALMNSKCIQLPCKHAFHGLCIQYWVSHSGEEICPVCRQSTTVSNGTSKCIFAGR